MGKFFVLNRVRNIITVLVLFISIVFYTIFISSMIRSSEHTITLYFFLMLGWFLTIFLLGLASSVLIGDLFFGKLWKKEHILIEPLTDDEKLSRTSFKDYKYHFRAVLVLIIGVFIFIFNQIGGDIFDFYNKVGLHLAQLRYKNPKKQIESIKSLYLLKDQKYDNLIKRRVKEFIKKSENSESRSWGIWFLKEKGSIEDIPFILDYLNDKNGEVVGEAADGLHSILLKRYEKEEDKILNNMYNPKFQYGDRIKESCKKVNYPKQCIMTIAYFDGAHIYKVIKNKLDQKELYPIFVWILANSSKKISEDILIHIYENGTFEDRCLAVVAFGRVKSEKGEKILLRDFDKLGKKICPTIKVQNRGADPYIIGKPKYFSAKVLEAIDKIESLKYETRDFLFKLSQNKKWGYSIRKSSQEIYEKHEYKFKNSKKK